MPINWQDKEVADRLLAAIIASFDNKINCTEVARLYGPDATYSIIKNFLRKPKKQALQLKTEAQERDGLTGSPAKHSKKPNVSLVKGAVKTGRVVKKKAAPAKVKPEVVDDDVSVSDNVTNQVMEDLNDSYNGMEGDSEEDLV